MKRPEATKPILSGTLGQRTTLGILYSSFLLRRFKTHGSLSGGVRSEGFDYELE